MKNEKSEYSIVYASDFVEADSQKFETYEDAKFRLSYISDEMDDELTIVRIDEGEIVYWHNGSEWEKIC